MGKRNWANQKGFAITHLVLLLVALGLVGGAGWYVMNAQKNTNKQQANSAAEEDKETPKLIKLEIKDLNLTFEAPEGWQVTEDKSDPKHVDYLINKKGSDVSIVASNITSYPVGFSGCEGQDSDLEPVAITHKDITATSSLMVLGYKYDDFDMAIFIVETQDENFYPVKQLTSQKIVNSNLEVGKQYFDCVAEHTPLPWIDFDKDPNTFNMIKLVNEIDPARGGEIDPESSHINDAINILKTIVWSK